MKQAQIYLQTKTLKDLEQAHGINFRIHDYKVSLNYDMLNSRDSDLVSQQCRGCVIAKKDFSLIKEDEPLGDTVVLCNTMDRFFNHGQEAAVEIDFSNKHTRYYEKLDGTMTALYFDTHAKRWCVATRSVPEANLLACGHDITFRQLFEIALEETTGMKFDEWIEYYNPSTDRTYIFELCTPLNVIVVKHATYKLYLLAVRNNNHDCEYHIESYHANMAIGVPVCPSYKLNTLEEVINFISVRNPLKYEGVVVADKNFNRVKIKSPGYVAASRIKIIATSTPRALVELCLLGKLDDTISLLDNRTVERAYAIKDGLVELARTCDEGYKSAIQELNTNFHWGDEKKKRKELALIVKRDGLQMPYVMSRYNNKCKNYRDWINGNMDQNTGSYSKIFLETLLRKIEKFNQG